MSRSHADAPATYFRLSEESWAEIAREYRNGSTARELAVKWRTTASSVYRRACADGWSKKKDGDAAARAHAAAIEAEEQADLERAWPGTRGGLGAGAVAELVPAQLIPGIPDDAVELSRAAMEAAGRAMRLGRLGEAQGLARLSEMFARRMGEDPEGRLLTIYLAVFAPGFAERAMKVEGPDEGSTIKSLFWEAKAKREAEAE